MVFKFTQKKREKREKKERKKRGKKWKKRERKSTKINSKRYYQKAIIQKIQLSN